MARMNLLVRNLSVQLISFYQEYVRIILPHSCRFWPTCSEYSQEAILKYGFIKGGIKAVSRICQCHPFSGKSGFHPLK
ncbi:MAG: membrane protein insertion efficiency factor YidD [Candidatus Omnitrophota bacterium]